jgi:hypothetical protein
VQNVKLGTHTAFSDTERAATVSKVSVDLVRLTMNEKYIMFLAALTESHFNEVVQVLKVC